MKINSVNFMYVELCYKSSTSKYKKSKSNINIFKISHLPFDMFFFTLKMTTLCQMQRQSTRNLKRLVVQKCANGLTI